MPTLDKDIIEAAIDGLEAKKQHIETQIAELRAMLKGAPASTTAKSGRGGKRKLSPEARQRMREAQQRRWATARGEVAPAAKKSAKPKAKRKLSAAGRKAIAEAQKKRWAAKKAAAKA
jgi:hypothetical protein